MEEITVVLQFHPAEEIWSFRIYKKYEFVGTGSADMFDEATQMAEEMMEGL